jgi:hypothetical protein
MKLTSSTQRSLYLFSARHSSTMFQRILFILRLPTITKSDNIKFQSICVISIFHRHVIEICYFAQRLMAVSYRRFESTSFLNCFTLEDGNHGFPETSVKRSVTPQKKANLIYSATDTWTHFEFRSLQAFIWPSMQQNSVCFNNNNNNNNNNILIIVVVIIIIITPPPFIFSF